MKSKTEKRKHIGEQLIRFGFTKGVKDNITGRTEYIKGHITVRIWELYYSIKISDNITANGSITNPDSSKGIYDFINNLKIEHRKTTINKVLNK